jgi:hypothetical protein
MRAPQQVFLNLFLNAKDAMNGGGTLQLSTMNCDSVSVRVLTRKRHCPGNTFSASTIHSSLTQTAPAEG